MSVTEEKEGKVVASVEAVTQKKLYEYKTRGTFCVPNNIFQCGSWARFLLKWKGEKVVYAWKWLSGKEDLLTAYDESDLENRSDALVLLMFQNGDPWELNIFVKKEDEPRARKYLQEHLFQNELV